MKICMVNNDVYTMGGGERVFFNLANEFSKDNEVFLISIQKKNSFSFEMSSSIKEIFILNNEGVRIRNCYFRLLLRLRSFLQERKIDTVIYSGSGCFLFLPATFGLDIKVITCEHTNLKNKLWVSGIMAKTNRLFARIFTDTMICLTKEDVSEYKRRYLFRDKNITHIYNWIERPYQNTYSIQQANDKKLLTVGRYDYVKGYDMIKEVGNILLQYTTNWEWHIYGPDLYNLKDQLVLELPDCLKKNIFFHNESHDVFSLYDDATCYICMSRYEGLPMTLLEAQSRGLPVVSFACPTGPADIIVQGFNGELILPNNVQEMAERINFLLCNPDTLIFYSRNIPSIIGKFSKEVILSQWETILSH